MPFFIFTPSDVSFGAAMPSGDHANCMSRPFVNMKGTTCTQISQAILNGLRSVVIVGDD